MTPTAPSAAGPAAASAQTRLRARRSSVGTHPDVVAEAGLLSRRDGVLSGLEDHTINDAQRQRYASRKSNSDSPRKSTRAEDSLLTGNQDGVGDRGARMDKSLARRFEQSNNRSPNKDERAAAASLPTTTNGPRAGAGAGYSSMPPRAKTKV